MRSGGHSLAGHSSGAGVLVIDTRDLRGLHIDPERRLAWAGAGLTAGEYTTAAAAHGLATPFGDTGSVGIAGLTLGGGIGWLARKHGLAIDALVEAEIVTADGALVTASETEHPDLFWAIRGGGGNFGIVTRFTYRLYPVEQILGGAPFLPPTLDMLRSLVPIAASAPEGADDDRLHHADPARAFRGRGASRQPEPRPHVRVRRRSRSRPGGDRPVQGGGDPLR